MLGVIHRCVLEKGPEQIRKFFKLEVGSNHPDGRSSLRRHNKQLKTYRTGRFLETTAKSIFGLIDVYNLLPQGIVDTDNVHTFQAKLQGLLKDMVNERQSNWETIFSPRHALHSHPLAKRMQMVVTIRDNGDWDGVGTCDEPLRRNEGDVSPRDVPPSWW